MNGKKKKTSPSIYQDYANSLFIIGTISFIIIVYMFFFLSSNFVHEPTPATPLNEPLMFDEETRSVTLLEAEYSPEQQIMEVKIQLHNSDFDGIETYAYYVDILRGNNSRLEIEEVAHSDIITVVQIHHLKPRFKELTLNLAPQLDEITENNLTSLVITKDNYSVVSEIKTLKAQDYLIEKLHLTIEQLQLKISETEELIKQKEEEISAAEKKNADLEKSKVFFTTEERESVDQEISTNNGYIEQLTAEVDSLKQTIADCQSQIKETNKLIAEYETNEKE